MNSKTFQANSQVFLVFIVMIFAVIKWVNPLSDAPIPLEDTYRGEVVAVGLSTKVKPGDDGLQNGLSYNVTSRSSDMENVDIVESAQSLDENHSDNIRNVSPRNLLSSIDADIKPGIPSLSPKRPASSRPPSASVRDFPKQHSIVPSAAQSANISEFLAEILQAVRNQIETDYQKRQVSRYHIYLFSTAFNRLVFQGEIRLERQLRGKDILSRYYLSVESQGKTAAPASSLGYSKASSQAADKIVPNTIAKSIIRDPVVMIFNPNELVKKSSCEHQTRISHKSVGVSCN